MVDFENLKAEANSWFVCFQFMLYIRNVFNKEFFSDLTLWLQLANANVTESNSIMVTINVRIFCTTL